MELRSKSKEKKGKERGKKKELQDMVVLSQVLVNKLRAC